MDNKELITIHNKLISIIVPCRNEELFIRKCIESILNFSLPDNIDIEVLLVDGMSEDHTREIIGEFTQKDNRILLLDNPAKIHVKALNLGINSAHGDYILRLDAHSAYPSNYLILLYETLLITNADNVGGQFVTLNYSDKLSAKLVQAISTHPFGVGSSGFRTDAKADYADTVPYGFFKKEVFEKYGLFNEKLLRNQDFEFNKRIWNKGGKVYRNPEIKIYYYNQPSLYSFLKKQFNFEGPYHPYTWHLAPYCFNFRHAIPLFFTLSFIFGLILSFFFKWCLYIFISVMTIYIFIAIISSIKQSIRYKNFILIFALPLSFFLYHFIYGLGILMGCVKILLKKAPIQK